MKDIHVKLKGVKYTISVESNESLADFVNKLRETAQLSQDVKLISKGKVVTSDTFSNIVSGDVLMAYERSNTEKQLEVDKQVDKQNDNKNMYTHNQVKASIILFLDIVRSTSALKNMYDNNFTQLLTDIIYNEQLDSMLKKILDKSNDIVESISKNESINIVIDLGDNELFKNNSNTETSEQETEHMDLKKLYDTQLRQLTTLIGVLEFNSFDFNQAMPESDMKNIFEIVHLKYNPCVVLYVYVKNDKNKENTIRFLQNYIN